MKNHKKKASAMELHDDEGVVLHDTLTVEAVDDNPVKRKKKRHRNKLSSTVEVGNKISVMQSESQAPIADHPVKEKKKKPKNKLSVIEPDAEILIKEYSSYFNCVNDELYKENNTKFCTEDNDEVYVEQHLLPLNDHPIKKMKKKHKKVFVQQDDSHLMWHASNVESRNAQTITGKKKKHRYKSSVANLRVQLDSEVEPIGNLPSKKKKKKNKTKAFSTKFNKDLRVQHDLIYEQLGFKVEPMDNPLKKKNNHKTKTLSSLCDKNLNVEYDSDLESVEEHLSKKKHKTETLSTNYDKDNVQYDSEFEPIEEHSSKKRKKKHKTKTFSTDCDKDLNVQYDSNLESVEEHSSKKRKKKHKTKTLSTDCDKYLNVQYDSELEPIEEHSSKKRKKKHRTKTLSTDCDKDLNVQYDTEVEPFKEHSPKKRKKNHKTKILLTEFDKDLSVQVQSEVESIDPPLKKQKNRHRTKKLPTKFDKDIVMQLDSEVEPIDNPPFKKPKNINKTKTFYTEPNEDLDGHYDSESESIEKKPPKKHKKKHHTKMLFTEQNKLVIQSDSEVKSLDDPLFKKQNKRNNTKTLSTEHDKGFIMQLDLEKCKPVENPPFKIQKESSKIKLLSTVCIKDLAIQLGSEVKPIDDSPDKKQKKRVKYKTTFSTELDKNLVLHNSNIVTANDTLLKKQKNRNKMKKNCTPLGEGHVVQLDSVVEPVGDSSLKDGLYIERIDDKPLKRKKTILPIVKDDKLIDQPVEEGKKYNKKSSFTELDDSMLHYAHVQESSSTENDEALVVQLASQVQLAYANESEFMKEQPHLIELVDDSFAKSQCSHTEPTNDQTVTGKKEMCENVFSTTLDELEKQHRIPVSDDFDLKNSSKHESTSFFKRFNKDEHCIEQLGNKSESVSTEIPNLQKNMSHKTQSMRKKLFNIDKQQSYINDKNNSREIPKSINCNNFLNQSNDDVTQKDLPDTNHEKIINQLEKGNVKHNEDSKFSSGSCLSNQELIDNCNAMPVDGQHKRKSSMEQNDTSCLVHESYDSLKPPVENKNHKINFSSLEQDNIIGTQHDLDVESIDSILEKLLKEKKKKSSSIVLGDDNYLTMKHSACAVESSSTECVEDLEIQHDSHKLFEDSHPCKESEIEHCYESFSFGDNETLTHQNSTLTVPVNNLLEVPKRPYELTELVDNSFVDQHYTVVKPTQDQLVKEKRKMHKAFPCIEPNDRLYMQHDVNTEQANDAEMNKKNNIASLRIDKEGCVDQQQENISEYATAKDLSSKKSILYNTRSLSKKLLENEKQEFENIDTRNIIVGKHHSLRLTSRNNKYVDDTNQSNKKAQVDSPEERQKITLNRLESDTSKQETDLNCSFKSNSSLSDVYAPIHGTKPDFDFTDEPVNFEIPLLHSSEVTEHLTEEKKSNLISKGVVIKMGKFSLAEDAILKRNYENFIKEFHVDDPQLLLGIGLGVKNKKVFEFRKAKHFFVRLGKDLNDRPLFNLYRRARLLFDPMRNEHTLDKQEAINLKKLHMRKGNKWQKIGEVINKGAITARSAFQWHDKAVQTGVWTDEESKNLIKAIRTVAGVKDLSLLTFEKFPWEKVAELVRTRNYSQCRLHWLEHLSWKLKEKKWDVNDYVKLISILGNECFVEDYTKIDWENVQKCFGDSSPSWQLLRKKWYYMRNKLPRENRSNLRKMLDSLSLKYGK